MLHVLKYHGVPLHFHKIAFCAGVRFYFLFFFVKLWIKLFIKAVPSKNSLIKLGPPAQVAVFIFLYILCRDLHNFHLQWLFHPWKVALFIFKSRDFQILKISCMTKLVSGPSSMEETGIWTTGGLLEQLIWDMKNYPNLPRQTLVLGVI